MTAKELREQLKDVPDDCIVWNAGRLCFDKRYDDLLTACKITQALRTGNLDALRELLPEGVSPDDFVDNAIKQAEGKE